MEKHARVDYFDGLRAVAIAAVLALHWLSWYSPFLHGGSVGVDVFFVLSGFIITTMLWRGPLPGGTAVGAWWSFVRRRVVRLYPALLGLVAGACLLYAVTPGAPLHPAEVARRGALVLTQATSLWAAGQHGTFWLPTLQPFAHTWSLAVEWYFYLLWPAVVLLARRRGVPARALAFASLASAALLYALSLPLSPFWFYFGPSARFAELLAGGALGLWRLSVTSPAPRWRHGSAVSAAALLVIGAITLLAPAAHAPLYRWVEVPVTAAATVVLIQAAYSAPGTVVHRLLSHRWLAAVGRSSYSLYLWHLVPLLLLQRSGLPIALRGVLVVSATAVVTALSYRWLERPFLRGRGDVLRPRAVEATAGRRWRRSAAVEPTSVAWPVVATETEVRPVTEAAT